MTSENPQTEPISDDETPIFTNLVKEYAASQRYEQFFGLQSIVTEAKEGKISR